MPEIITLGEAMIRLAPPHFKRLEQTDSLDVEIGGSELNTGVGLARLGHSVSWVSRLPSNPLGQLLANRVRETGVSIEHLLWSETDRLGLYFLEFGAAPRASGILYDRADSAMARLQPGMLNWNAIFHGAKWFHVTGITPALSDSTRRAVRAALEAAKNVGVSVSLEVNFRSKLWSFEQAGEWLKETLPLADVLVTNPDEIDKFFGISVTSLPDAARELTTRYPLRAVAITLRETPSVWKNSFTAVAYSRGHFYETRKFEVEIVDRLGSGDAFDAGLIHGLLHDDLQLGLDYGIAMAALKHTIPGDLPWINEDEIKALLSSGSLRISR
jgi:2-dehydro-3-deoxygluconokinase